MALPDNLPTVTLVGTYTHPDGSPMKGSVSVTPTPGKIVAADTGLTIQGRAKRKFDGNGQISLTVLATDAEGINPQNFTYQVTIAFPDTTGDSFPIELPAAAPIVKLPAITRASPSEGDYVVITGPPGPPGASGSTYQHTQTSASATWQVAHNLGRPPNISVLRPDGRVAYADIEHTTANLAVITFPTPIAGTATCS
ncbi:hypothetical protein [Streptomyces sp900116325]|uniref:hypothetical protein n=1 Tax=Streptomyces sp. 900116325 TaxID=3154295 RepID=UPI0033CEFE20